jgi:hypothetical protein
VRSPSHGLGFSSRDALGPNSAGTGAVPRPSASSDGWYSAAWPSRQPLADLQPAWQLGPWRRVRRAIDREVHFFRGVQAVCQAGQSREISPDFKSIRCDDGYCLHRGKPLGHRRKNNLPRNFDQRPADLPVSSAENIRRRCIVLRRKVSHGSPRTTWPRPRKHRCSLC